MSETLLNKDHHKKLSDIINHLWERPESSEFRQPVDYVALKLNDYPIIIKKPMDLAKVKKNLKGGNYKSVEDCLEDIQLIWTNCKTYNADFSKIFKLASKLESVTKKLVKENFPTVKNFGRTNQTLEALRKDDFLQLEEHEEVAYPEKVRISQKVRDLTQEQLGDVVK